MAEVVGRPYVGRPARAKHFFRVGGAVERVGRKLAKTNPNEPNENASKPSAVSGKRGSDGKSRDHGWRNEPITTGKPRIDAMVRNGRRGWRQLTWVYHSWRKLTVV